MSEPDNDTLQMLGAFDRKCKVDRHTATHWGYLRGVIKSLDDAGQNDVADTLIWQVWHRVNSVARAHEFYRLNRDEMIAAQNESARLRRILLDGPATPQECAEFCKCALEDGDGKHCIDCESERFVLP